MIISHDFPLHPAFTTPWYKTQVQSHAVTNVVIEANAMRHHIIYLSVSLALLFLLIDSTLQDQSSVDNPSYLLKTTTLIREKRQLEDLEDDEYPTPSSQEAGEESGFWDKVVKVALRLFNKFIEWLNSS
ncbi:uncharacterized protein LOC125064281 [Vanessa atalanta]|uniref:uncharacterized protein LOC125064281 n=1 Tax=Vanessa atalanta TaxID=42275 RepID=UPI001FCD51EC|nr:uncharacterized protein LOC125064281 [Vanessa atalanta]